MRFLTLYTPKQASAGQPSAEHLAAMGQLIGEMLENGTLVATGALLRREQHALRVKLNNGQLLVEEGVAAASDWMGANGFAVMNAASREQLVEGIHRFLATAGDGTSEAIQLMDGPSDAAEKPSVEAVVRRTVHDWLAAIGRKDASASLKFLSEHLIEFNLAPPLRAPHATARGLNAWFDTWKGNLTIDVRDLKVESEGKMALAYGLVRLRGTKTDGPETELWYRSTIGLREIDGRWLITHVHDSVPFHMDGSLRAATELKPD